MTTQSFTVLAVSADRSILRRLHWLLSAFGYQVRTLADPTRASRQVQLETPHFLIMDANCMQGRYDVLRQFRRQRLSSFPFSLLLVDDQSKADLREAIDAGFDDFLENPVNNAEVLSRLRAGARYLTFERRAGTLFHTDPLTGLLTRESLLDTLRRDLEKPVNQGREFGCLFLELDLAKEKIPQSCASALEETTLTAVAEAICEQGGNAAIAARWEGTRFCAIQPDLSLDDAGEWGERIRSAVAVSTEAAKRGSDRITVSMGVGSFRLESNSIDGALQNVAEALQIAIEGGGDCVVRVGEYGSERDEWFQSFRDGNPFLGAKARDAMTPFAYCLKHDQTVGDAADKLKRFQVGMLPVVSANQKILGLVRTEDLMGGPNGTPQATDPLESVMANEHVLADGDVSFALVMQHLFDNRDCQVVVVDDDVPQGLITYHALRALAETLSVNSFAASESVEASFLQRLAVPAPEIGDSRAGKDSSYQLGGFANSVGDARVDDEKHAHSA